MPDDAGVLRYGPVFHRYLGCAVAAIFLVLVMAVLLLMQSRQLPLVLTGREKLILALYLTFILLGLVSTVLQSGS